MKTTQQLVDEIRQEYVFYNEAVKILEKKYKYNSARTKLYQLIAMGKVEKIEPFNSPVLYKKSDLLTFVNN